MKIGISPIGTSAEPVETKQHKEGTKLAAKAQVEEESRRRMADRNLWSSAMNLGDKAFDEILERTSPEAKVRLAQRIQKIVQEGKPIGQQVLGQLKDHKYAGNAMAVLEISSLSREAWTLGNDVVTGARWVFNKGMSFLR